MPFRIETIGKGSVELGTHVQITEEPHGVLPRQGCAAIGPWMSFTIQYIKRTYNRHLELYKCIDLNGTATQVQTMIPNLGSACHHFLGNGIIASCMS